MLLLEEFFNAEQGQPLLLGLQLQLFGLMSD
jgi:hypothetical protein